MDQVAILEHLGKPEALLEVGEAAAAGDVDVVDGAVPAAGAARLVDGEVRLPRPLLVLGVAGGAVRVVVALDDLGPQVVGSAVDPEARAFVEGLVSGRGRGVGRRVLAQPAERLGPDLGRRLRVRVAAPRNQLQAKVDVRRLVERQPAQDEVAAVKARDCFAVRVVSALCPEGFSQVSNPGTDMLCE